MFPDTTQEYESQYGRLEDQPQGSIIVGWSVEDEADWIEDKESNSDLDPSDLYGDDLDSIVIGEVEE